MKGETCGQRTLTKGRIAFRVVIDDCIIPFTAYTAAETSPMLFSGPDNPKWHLLVEGLGSPSNTWFLGFSRVYPPIGISIGHPFCKDSRT